MSAIYILLPVHNRKEITRGFVECLKEQTFSNYRLLLIDDGSIDGTAEMVAEHVPAATILRGNGNWWWAGSLQRGLDWLNKNVKEKNPLILFINDDVHFPPDYLERAIQVMENKNDVFMLSRYKSPDGSRESGVVADLNKLSFKEAESPEEINCLSTRGLFVHWEDVKKNGNFHPRLLPHYLSDYEYTMRAYRKGFKCETSTELLIEENNKTTGFHVIKDESFVDFLKKYFSIKSPSNPFYFSSFILLTCSPKQAIVNLMRIWLGVFKSIGRALITRNKAC